MFQNFESTKGVICFSSLRLYINLSFIVLSLEISFYIHSLDQKGFKTQLFKAPLKLKSNLIVFKVQQ